MKTSKDDLTLETPVTLDRYRTESNRIFLHKYIDEFINGKDLSIEIKKVDDAQDALKKLSEPSIKDKLQTDLNALKSLSKEYTEIVNNKVNSPIYTTELYSINRTIRLYELLIEYINSDH
ncbi:MAG: hypothetical protein PHX80_04460 [Candidatus Nanoarchaeia archaeon]|nr:hypothetical protein [Candidatus Nanoarchaeia archaeon]